MNSTDGESGGEPVHPATAGDCLILVVDDESTIRRMIERCLRHEGFQVLTASDGNEAIEMFQKERTPIALVLTDLVMPGMDGFALIRGIRRESNDVKIVASSGYLGSCQPGELTEELRQLGVKTFLSKPYTTEELMEAIRRELKEEN